ncbi:hypothetical protein VAE151_630645 [Vibrio aestuarianus]|uniref:Uncharacterized protein n=1 Tax=Vibrio aestuarianus TaxID=28171 RepID=A0ABM9FJP0_9VIBR|nr:hypothetical protein VAE063_1010119 [Vibrio aestuarianus]CAH8223052.1 hypothetical protein VAE308_1260013 [Vibrio aestuarianus]CAH8227750.1 hypothetical protein VAE032_330118 [Vibrio aestuarianus]CAH8227774.1 hypothetical protein VAE128_500637 [Vibrio aestuarianus]CAH8227820.1 hypothetical protein VAE055_420645 [Vibrio aestuarianus]
MLNNRAALKQIASTLGEQNSQLQHSYTPHPIRSGDTSLAFRLKYLDNTAYSGRYCSGIGGK